MALLILCFCVITGKWKFSMVIKGKCAIINSKAAAFPYRAYIRRQNQKA